MERGVSAFEKYGLHPPSLLLQVLESLFGYQIHPHHIADNHRSLINDYPELGGDKTALGLGNYGGYQSYHGDKRWWVDLFLQFEEERSFNNYS